MDFSTVLLFPQLRWFCSLFAVPFTSCTCQDVMYIYILLHAFQTTDLYTYFYNCSAKIQIFQGLFLKPNHIYPLLPFAPMPFIISLFLSTLTTKLSISIPSIVSSPVFPHSRSLTSSGRIPHPLSVSLFSITPSLPKSRPHVSMLASRFVWIYVLRSHPLSFSLGFTPSWGVLLSVMLLTAISISVADRLGWSLEFNP